MSQRFRSVGPALLGVLRRAVDHGYVSSADAFVLVKSRPTRTYQQTLTDYVREGWLMPSDVGQHRPTALSRRVVDVLRGMPTAGVVRYSASFQVVAYRIRTRGPTGPDEAHQLIGATLRSAQQMMVRWAAAGWLRQVAPHVYTLPEDGAELMPQYKNEADVEGSDQWLVLQQLAHQMLSVPDIIELLDCKRTKAMSVLYTLRSFDYVRHAGDGMWELAPHLSGTSLQT